MIALNHYNTIQDLMVKKKTMLTGLFCYTDYLKTADFNKFILQLRNKGVIPELLN